MIAIARDCETNARGMLANHRPLGQFGPLAVYCIDGKAWIDAGETILRSDNVDETAALIRAAQYTFLLPT